MTKSPTPETPSTPSVSPDTSSPDKTRRSLAGLGASAIFTLASRPVLAVTCNTPSAHASGNLSFHGTPPNCTGQTPAQWVALLSVSDSRNVTFHAPDTSGNNRNGVFKTGTRADWNNSTLRTVMSTPGEGNTGSTPNPISAEFAATLLNIRAGYIPVLTEPQLIGMWNEWMDNGQFIPTAGATPWLAADIVTYLRRLQGA